MEREIERKTERKSKAGYLCTILTLALTSDALNGSRDERMHEIVKKGVNGEDE